MSYLINPLKRLFDFQGRAHPQGILALYPVANGAYRARVDCHYVYLPVYWGHDV